MTAPTSAATPLGKATRDRTPGGDLVFSLKAYFDDSGATEQAVGGCVASVEAWSAFDDQWRAVLDYFHFPEFHAVEFENRAGRFRQMCEGDRSPFRSALLDVLTQTVNPSTGGAFVCAFAHPEDVEQLKVAARHWSKPPKEEQNTQRIEDGQTR